MFAFSKIVGAFTNPLCWVLALALIGLFVQVRGKRAKAGQGWFVSATFLLIFLGWEWPPTWLVARLESAHQPRPTLTQPVVGVIVLGGGTDGSKLTGPAMPIPMGEAAERLTETLVLTRQHPEWKIIFTGGGGSAFPGGYEGWSEANIAAQWWQRLGEPTKNLLLEEQSRNTAENAMFSARLPGVNKTEPWMLLTSAWHMPRAVQAFELAGWHVTAYPVDFRGNTQRAWLEYSFKRSLSLWQIAIREYIGLAAIGWQVR